MEFVIAVSLGVLAATFAVHLVGGSEWFARLMVATAMARLPQPLRDRASEECHAEFREIRGSLRKLYIVLTCFFDAVRLERLWRSERLRRMAEKSQEAPADKSERWVRRYLDDRDRAAEAKEARDFPTVEGAKTGGAQPRKLSPPSNAARLPSRLSRLFRPNVYKPRQRTSQKLLVLCCGKVFRLDGGIWVNDW